MKKTAAQNHCYSVTKTLVFNSLLTIKESMSLISESLTEQVGSSRLFRAQVETFSSAGQSPG